MAASNYLEQLVAEWYEFQGCFVRRNVLVGKRPNGGFEGELDVVAFNPLADRVAHVECSMDADSWPERQRKLEKKFAVAKKFIGDVFPTVRRSTAIDQIAYLGFVARDCERTVAGARVLSVSRLVAEIIQELSTRSIRSQAVHEGLPLIRTIQFVLDYGNVKRDQE